MCFPALFPPHFISQALKPYFVKITGPLIRVVADKFPYAVKTAILKTLRQVSPLRLLQGPICALALPFIWCRLLRSEEPHCARSSHSCRRRTSSHCQTSRWQSVYR
jgi:hypothetical protein